MKQKNAGLNGKLRFDLYESFTSINGEVNFRHQGSLTHFLRFSGCNLSPGCLYCDTTYAQCVDDGQVTSIRELMKTVPSVTEVENITITGGEPLVQSQLVYLIELLAKRGYYVNIETNGSLPIPRILSKLRDHVGWTIDLKLPSSGHYNLLHMGNLPKDLCNNDWIKFVIANPTDYACARSIMKIFDKSFTNFAFSPMVTNTFSANDLAGWMLVNKDKAVLSVQLHKLIGVK